MSTLNEIICDVGLNGWCNRLKKNKKNTGFVVLLSIFFTYIYPIVIFLLILYFYGNMLVGTFIFDMFSPALPCLSLIYQFTTKSGFFIFGIISLVILIPYIIYMTKQIGIYIALPIGAEILKIFVFFFVPYGLIISIVLSLIPFMSIAVIGYILLETKKNK